MRKAEKQQKQGVSRQGSRFKNSVAELKERMDRVDSALDKELTEVCKSRTVDTVVGSSSEVYRDKNTLVEVTIHRRPKAEMAVKRVEGRNSAPEAGRLESRTKKGDATSTGGVAHLASTRRVASCQVNCRCSISMAQKLFQVENHRNLEGQLTKLRAELEKQKIETSWYNLRSSLVQLPLQHIS